MEDPDRFLDLPRPEPDGLLLTDPSIRSMYLRAVRESVKQGVDAYAWECVIERRRVLARSSSDRRGHLARRSGLDSPTISGGRSRSRLPHNHLRLVPEAAHGLILTAWADILDDLNP